MSTLSLSLRGTILVALSGMLFGLMGFLGTKIMDGGLSIETMLFWRFLLASVFIALSLCWSKTALKFNLKAGHFLQIFIISALSYSGCSAFYFVASEYIGTGLAMVIFFSFPVFVTLFAWVFEGWRMNKYAFASLLAVLIGLICLRGEGEASLNLTGIAWAALAAFSYAVYVFSSQFNIKKMDSRCLTLLVCVGNTLLFLCLALYNQTFIFPASVSLWFYILALSFFATVLPIQFLLDGLKYISSIKASILSVLEPVVTVFIGMLLLDESMTMLQFFGVLVVLVGAILIQFEANKTDALT